MRQEHSEDMSILEAFSIVLERRPDLRFCRFMSYATPRLLSIRYSHCIKTLHLKMSFPAGKKDLPIRYFNGTCVEWKVGLPQMQIPSHLNAGIRQVIPFHEKFCSYRSSDSICQ